MALQIGEQVEGSSPILSVRDGEPTQKVSTDIMLSVEHLEMIAAPDRPDGCTIYGYFRVSDKEECAAPFSLFNRERNDAATVDLGESRSRFLPLSDDRRSARPVFGGSIFYVQLKLWEKIEDEGEVKDPVIVDVDIKFDDFFKSNRRTFLEFEGNFGFKFNMAYAHIFGGVYVKVQFTILEDTVPGRSSRKRQHPMLIYGSIGATQGISENEVPVIELFYAPSSDPLQVEIGSPVPLQREFVVALTGGGCLGIAWKLRVGWFGPFSLPERFRLPSHRPRRSDLHEDIQRWARICVSNVRPLHVPYKVGAQVRMEWYSEDVVFWW